MKDRIPTCQFCGCTAELHLPGLVINEARRCQYCEGEWAALAGRYRDPRTISRHWRARAAERKRERWALIDAAHLDRAA